MTLNPSQKTPAYTAMASTYHKVDTLLAGTTAMRAASTTYLPKHAEESDANYQTRLQRSTLVNYYGRALDAAIGHAHKQPVVVKKFPASLSPLLKDIDGAGNTLDQFSQEELHNTLHHGIVAFVVDYPTLEGLPEKPTLADVKRLQARSYVYSVTAPQFIAAYTLIENGQERLLHFRFATTEIVPSADFMEEATVTKVIAYEQLVKGGVVTVQTWTDTEQGWITDGPKTLRNVTEMPIVFAYGWKTGTAQGKPVLGDLADLNVAHWQSLSEQTNILSIARVPFLHAKGSNLNTTTPQTDGTSVSDAKMVI